MKKLSKTVTTTYSTNLHQLWNVLTKPEYTEKYMFNCRVETNLLVGSPIIWRGVFQGVEQYLEGEILISEPQKKLKYSIVDPSLFDPQKPESYVHVSYELKQVDHKHVQLKVTTETFDGNKERLEHASGGWEVMIFSAIADLL